jgi:hypothetical protein
MRGNMRSMRKVVLAALVVASSVAVAADSWEREFAQGIVSTSVARRRVRRAGRSKMFGPGGGGLRRTRVSAGFGSESAGNERARSSIRLR